MRYCAIEAKLTGEKVWSKAQAIKRDIKADLYGGIWSRLCPGNRLPSGKTVKEIFTQWWHCHYNVHSNTPGLLRLVGDSKGCPKGRF